MTTSSIELYNCEGPCLAVFRRGDNLFEIIDQWSVPLRFVNKGELLCIYHGLETLTDSSGKVWDLKREWSKEAMPRIEDILEFVKEPFFKKRRAPRDDEWRF
ncbi:MAG: hypothetical protein EBX50_14270 [Chitinophagia bacterium]|nr:hypothetical protein [Chitinophagia bacterium]